MLGVRDKGQESVEGQGNLGIGVAGSQSLRNQGSGHY